MTCEICAGPRGKRSARGMCSDCYQGERRTGAHLRRPRLTTSSEDVAETVAVLRYRGMDLGPVATTLGMKPESVVRSLERRKARLRDAGDVSGAAALGETLTLFRRDLVWMQRSA